MFVTIIVSLIIFGLLIFVHELGHFLAARMAKIKVLEFALGMGKEIISWEKGETRYTIRIFPLGGFCRMLGEDPDDPQQEDSFMQKSVGKRLGVIAAGSVMNFFLGIVLLFVIFFFILGIPQTNLSMIGGVLPDSRAYIAGLQEKDLILSVNETNVSTWEDLVDEIHSNPEKTLDLRIRRNMEEISLTVVPEEVDGQGLIGVTPLYKKYALLPSLSLGFKNFYFWFKFIYVGLYQMIMRIIPADVAGPVGIVSVIGEVMQEGMSNLFSLTAIISINLGIMNLLPIPALDGSKLLFLILEWIRRKPFDPRKESYVHLVGFALLILLMVLVAIHDIYRLIN